jgi:hypothetical protein
MRMIDHATTMEDLQDNPRAYGLPTFAEYCRNPSPYQKPTDSSFAALEKGPLAIRETLKKIKFKVNGVSVPTLEACEVAIGDFGYTIEDFEFGRAGHLSKLKYKMNMIPKGGQTFDVEVNFLP